MAVALIGIVLGASTISPVIASSSVGASFAREPRLQLVDATTWVLHGQKLASGACRYQYPSLEGEIPKQGWVLRSLVVDMDKCTKLMEEGTPVEPLTADTEPTMVDGSEITVTLGPTFHAGSSGGLAATTSTQGAWQAVIWRDFLDISVNRDVTQINWTYDGTNVLSGNAAGYWWHANTGWSLGAHSVTQGFFSGAFRGQTTATFSNGSFCAPSTVYTYYYYNRVWGHYNGTATRAQSSDSVNECLPLHVDVWSAYGQWN